MRGDCEVAGWAWPGYKCLVVTCPRCGASRGDGDRFCEDCGAPLGRCPSCGEPVTPGKPFCRSCGHQLSDPASAPSVPTSAQPGIAAGGPVVAARRGGARG